jgi:hypothetical protein
MAIKQKSANEWEGKHLAIFYEGVIKGRITDTWSVWNKYDDIPLGSVEWCTKFRKYSFYPLADRVFEQDCLRDIAEFIEMQTRLYLERKKEDK